MKAIKKELIHIAERLWWLAKLLIISFTFPVWLPIKLIFYPDYDDAGDCI